MGSITRVAQGTEWKRRSKKVMLLMNETVLQDERARSARRRAGLIGQIPLEHLDFVVDLRNRKLTGNPTHGGEHVYELF